MSWSKRVARNNFHFYGLRTETEEVHPWKLFVSFLNVTFSTFGLFALTPFGNSKGIWAVCVNTFLEMRQLILQKKTHPHIC